MHFDRQLWTFTAGVRLRIAWATLIGLLAVGLGMARLMLLAWLIAEVFAGPRAPEWVAELLSPDRVADAGVLLPDAVSRVAGKLAGAGAAAGETDEMALVGAVSVMLLHDRLVARPALAPALEPTRAVVGDRVEPRLEAAVA